MSIDLIKNRDHRNLARAVSRDFSESLGGHNEEIDVYVVKALADLKARGVPITQSTLVGRVKSALLREEPLEVDNNTTARELYSASPPMIGQEADSIVDQNRHELEQGRGSIGANVRRVGDRPVRDADFLDSVSDTSGAFLWNTVDALSVGLLGLAQTHLAKSEFAQRNDFMSGVMEAAENLRRADTEAGKWGAGIGQGLGIVVPAFFTGGGSLAARAGIKGATTAVKVAAAVNKVAPASVAFSTGRRGVSRLATKKAKERVVSEAGEVAAKAATRAAGELRDIDSSLNTLQGLQGVKSTLVARIAQTGDKKLVGKAMVDAKARLARVEAKIESIRSGMLKKGTEEAAEEASELITMRQMARGNRMVDVDDVGRVLVTKGGKMVEKEVPKVVEAVFHTQKSMSAEALKGATKGMVSQDAQRIMTQRLMKGLAKEIPDPVLRAHVSTEAGKALAELVMKKGTVNNLGHIFAKSPVLAGLSEKVGRVLQNFGEEAIGFATYGMMHRFTSTLEHAPDITPEAMADSIKHATDMNAMKGDVRTAFIFATGGGILVPAAGALGFLPLKVFFPSRHHESMGKAFRKIFGGAVDDYKPLHDSISEALSIHLKDAKRIGRVQALLKRKGSSLDPTRLMHAAELDYKKLAVDNPEALFLISKQLQNMARRETSSLSGMQGWGDVVGTDSAKMLDWLLRMRAASGNEALLKTIGKQKPKAFDRVAQHLQNMAEETVMKDRSLILKTFGADLVKNFATAMSIAVGGNPFTDADGDGIQDSDLFHMIEGVKDGHLHMSDLVPHMAFSFMSASHPLYRWGMGNFMIREYREKTGEIPERLSMTKAQMAENAINIQKHALGMGSDAFFDMAKGPNTVRSAVMPAGAAEASTGLIKNITERINAGEAPDVLVHHSPGHKAKNSERLGITEFDWHRQASIDEVRAVHDFLVEQMSAGIDLGVLGEVIRSGDFERNPDTVSKLARMAVFIKDYLNEGDFLRDESVTSMELNRHHIARAMGDYTTLATYRIAKHTKAAITAAASVFGVDGSSRSTDIHRLNIEVPREELAKVAEHQGVSVEQLRDAIGEYRMKADNLVDLGWITGQFTDGGFKTIKTAAELTNLIEAIQGFENLMSKEVKRPIAPGKSEDLSLTSRGLFNLVVDGINSGHAHTVKTFLVEKMDLPVETADGGTAFIRWNTILDAIKSSGILRQEGRDNRYARVSFAPEAVAHLSEYDQNAVRNLLRLVAASEANTKHSPKPLTKEMVQRLFGSDSSTAVLRGENGEVIPVRGGVMGAMRALSINMGDTYTVNNALRHLYEHRSSKLSAKSFMYYSLFRDIGLITESMRYGSTLHVPYIGEGDITRPGEIAKTILKAIAKERGNELPSDAGIDLRALELLEPYIREWKEVGLLDNMSTGKDGLMGAEDNRSFSFMASPVAKYRYTALVRAVESLEFGEWVNDGAALKDILDLTRRVEADPEYQKKLGFGGSKPMPSLTGRIIRAMNASSPYAFARVKRLLLDADIIAQDGGKIRLNKGAANSEKLMRAYREFDQIMFSEDMAADLIKVRGYQYESDHALSPEYERIWRGDTDHRTSVSTFLNDIGKAGDHVYNRDLALAVRKVAQAGGDPVEALENFVGTETLETSGIDKYRRFGVATSLAGTEFIGEVKYGDFEAVAGLPHGDPRPAGVKAATFKFQRREIPISRGFLSTLAENYGYEVMIMSGNVDVHGEKPTLLSRGKRGLQVLSDIEQLRYGKHVVAENTMFFDPTKTPAQGTEGSFMIPTFFGDMNSLLLHKLPGYGQAKPMAAKIRSMLESSEYLVDGKVNRGMRKEVQEAVKAALRSVERLENADSWDALQKLYSGQRNNDDLRTMFYFLQMHHMAGYEGVTSITNGSNIEKAVSRLRQAHSRSSTPTDPHVFERVLREDAGLSRAADKATVVVEGERGVRIAIVDDSVAGESPGGVSRFDSNVYTARWLLQAQARAHGFGDADIGVLKNSIGIFGGAETLITKQAGAYNATMEKWMNDNGIGMVVTKSAAKLMFGDKFKVAELGGREFSEAAMDGDRIVDSDISTVPVRNLKLNKVPHTKAATVSHQVENWMSDAIGADIENLYGAGYAEAQLLWGKIFAENTPEARILARQLALREIRMANGEMSAMTTGHTQNLSLLHEHLLASPYASPLDMRFGPNFEGVAKRRLINEKIFKLSNDSGHQMVLGTDIRKVLDSGEAVMSPYSRDIPLEFSENSTTAGLYMAVGFRDPVRASKDMGEWGGWQGDVTAERLNAGENHYNGNKMGDTHFAYRKLIRKMKLGGKRNANTEGFVYRMLMEMAEGRHRRGASGDLSDLFTGLSADKKDTVATLLNNLVVQGLSNRKTNVMTVEELKKTGIGTEKAERIIELADTIVGTAMENGRRNGFTMGGVYDGLAEVFGKYEYEQRRGGVEDGLTAVSWGFVGLNQRYPSARPNDTIPAVFLGFLDRKYGNQYVLNWNDAVRKGEADYDIDTFNYWFNSSENMLKNFARIRNISKDVPAAPSYGVFESSGQQRKFNPFSHRDMEAYAKSGAESQILRGRVIKAGKIIDKMVTDQIGVKYTETGKTIRLMPKYRSAREMMDNGQEDIMFISRMVQQIVDSKSGILPQRPTENADPAKEILVYSGMDPFKILAERMFEVEVDGQRIDRPLKPAEVKMLRAAMSPYAKLLRISKGVFEGEVSRGMTFSEVRDIAAEYVDDAIEAMDYAPHYHESMSRRLRTMMSYGKDAVSNEVRNSLEFVAENPNIGMSENSAIRVMRLSRLNSRDSHTGWSSHEDHSAREWAEKLIAEVDPDTATRRVVDDVIRFGMYRKSARAHRDELMNRLRSAEYRAAMGSKYAQMEADQLRTRLRYANEMHKNATRDEAGLLEVKVDKSNETEKTAIIRNTNAVTAVRLAMLDVPLSVDYVGTMEKFARDLRSERGKLYSRLYNGSEPGLTQEKVTARLEALVDRYMNLFGALGSTEGGVHEGGTHHADLAVLMLGLPNARGRAKFGSKSITVYQSMPQDIMAMALKHRTVTPAMRKRILASLGKAHAVVSAYDSGDIDGVIAVADYITNRLEAKYDQTLRDRLEISEKGGYATLRFKALETMHLVDPSMMGEVVRSDGTKAGKVGGLEFGAVVEELRDLPGEQLRRLQATATFKFKEDGTRRNPYEEFITELYGTDAAEVAMTISLGTEATPSQYMRNVRREATKNVKRRMEAARKEDKSKPKFEEHSTEVQEAIKRETRNVLGRMMKLIFNASPGEASKVRSTSPEEGNWRRFQEEALNREKGC